MAELLYPLLAVERLRMGTDGTGVTTLVASRGCPLRCRWCINKALLEKAPAENVSAQELIERVKIDELYFLATGGGVTFGGGESLLHAAFIRRFRELCPAEWTISVETSLAVPRENLEASLGAVDLFIVDCKDMDAEIYRRYTGADGTRMKENLRLLLDRAGPEKVLVRVPLIPRCNTPEDQKKSAAELRAMGVERLELFDYVIKE